MQALFRDISHTPGIKFEYASTTPNPFFGLANVFAYIPGIPLENSHALQISSGRILIGMASERGVDITSLLMAWNTGDEEALENLIVVVYPELRRIARRHLARRASDQTLESAALANEVYLRLIRAGSIQCQSRVHFFALSAQIIRRILVDHARNRRYAKRGGNAVQVPLNEALLGTRARGIEVLALDEALASLSKIDSRKARVVELRFFGGLSVEETAEFLQISAETVLRDWKMAKTWLFRELNGYNSASKARTQLTPRNA